VEIWGMPYFWQIKEACVPLPAPGAPNKISFMEFLGSKKSVVRGRFGLKARVATPLH